MKKIRVLYHDNCFDGLSSAAVFSRFYRAHVDAKAEIEYEGMTHKAGNQVEETPFGPDENAIVDFKYSASDNLTWWFDHHESAFLSPEDEKHFRSDQSGRKFHDPSFRSCTKYIASVARDTFGFKAADLDELIYWADIIDGAQFPDAQTAVELKTPAMRLMLVIEATHDRELLHRIVRLLQSETLQGVLDNSEVRKAFDGFYKHHLQSIDIMRQHVGCVDSVVEYDVSGLNLDGCNKFIPYYLFPQSIYCVGVSSSGSRAKVSVGTNPWRKEARIHNLARLCEQYGGGGHAVVAAISFKPNELDRAKDTAREIARKLQIDLKNA